MYEIDDEKLRINIPLKIRFNLTGNAIYLVQKDLTSLRRKKAMNPIGSGDGCSLFVSAIDGLKGEKARKIL